MAVIHCLPDEVTLACEPGTRILHALQEAGVPIAHACGGGARCSTCRVQVLAGLDACEPRNDAEQRIARMLRFPDDIRLACQTEIHGPVALRRLVLDEQDLLLTSRIHGVRGDGFMALFGAGDGRLAPAHATLAALALRDAARDMSRYVDDVYGRSFAVGMGVHAGVAVVGDVGALGQRRETAIGDTVNLASRIEAATKEAETDLLVLDRVRAHIEHFDLLDLAAGAGHAGDTAGAGHAGPEPGGIRFGRRFELPMKGKTGIFTVHEVLGPDER